MQVLHGMSVVYPEKTRLPLPCPYMTFSNIVNPHPALEEEHSYGASPIIFFFNCIYSSPRSSDWLRTDLGGVSFSTVPPKPCQA